MLPAEKSESTHYSTNHATGNYSTYCIHSQCHQICCPSKQTTHQHSNGCSWQNGPGCQQPLQHHYLAVYQSELSSTGTLANLWDSLWYIRTFSMHTMDYVDAATTSTLSPHILPIEDLKQMLSHIEETLPPTMHWWVSSEDTLHFSRYLHTHILIANRLIDTYRYPYTGSYTTTFSIQNFYLGYSSWKFHSMIWCKYPIPRSHTGWNYGSGNFTTPVTAYVKRLTDNFAMLMHLFNHLPTLHHASQPYTPRTEPALPLDAHYKSGRLKASAYSCQLLHMYGYWLQHLLMWQPE